ncbi:hypothetical protein CRYUN_Cryun35bG0057900 [Craigia yunnanensis]
MATLTVPATVPSVSEDCEQLRKAFSGWGTNEGLIIDILGHRNADQRKLILQAYTEAYGEDLLKAYHARYKKSLEEDVAQHTTGDLRKMHLSDY